MRPGTTRLTTWMDWYRFARRGLNLDHPEASAYATARVLEAGSSS